MRINGSDLTLAHVVRVAASDEPVLADPDIAPRIVASRQVVESVLSSGRVVYGVNTGFGKLSNVTIPPDDLLALQLNLVRSHACGVGAPLSEEETRVMLLLRANVLAKGFSGVRAEVLTILLDMLNRRVHPVIPEKGSVGASGDLAPLAHMALAAIGEGEAVYRGERMSGAEALRLAGITPITLEAKEGLALLNGTQAMAAVGGLAVARLLDLAELADVIAALSLEALHGTAAAFDPQIHNVRPHRGQKLVAKRLQRLLSGSKLMAAHRDCHRVQDAYSLRCIPQVHGAARDTLDFVRRTLEIELNAATDNPLIFSDTGDIISGGNFHGAPLALAFDHAATAATVLGAISERRIERLVNPDLSELPAFLTTEPGTHSGLMMTQVTAAALCNENTVLAHPASVASLPTSANKEDHVSMGMTGALKLRTVADNVATILAIELLLAARALEFLRPLRTSRRLQRVEDFTRSFIPSLDGDRAPAPLIETLKMRFPEILSVSRTDAENALL
jgi:histidine ammonia-lyase